ncbi:cytochrome P450 [Lampropedia puyangensis]|uniref:Cytochrome P450 n=1 Tax=Lampropedia puyangensis TaxID=1330072 RepID=A0A4S8F4I0_9BURK|nr:cytochrome P450 [Lampropedia puyangensis]THU01949.1 cytochrome P450 [Lampropedia puyangensis]
MSQTDTASNFCHEIYELARRWPKQNQVRAQPDGRRLLIIQNLDDADRIMRRNADNYFKNSKWLSQVAGNSRLTADSEAWKFRQKISQPFFGKYDHTRAFAISNIQARAIAEALVSSQDSTTLNEHVIHQGMASIFTQMFLEMELVQLPISHDSPSQLVELASAYAFVAPGQEKNLENKEHIRKILQLRKSIFDALAPLRDDTSLKSPLLKAILNAESEKNSDFSLEKELPTLIDAGTDTAAYSVGWGLHLLAAYPKLQERLYQSLSHIYASNADNPQALQSAIAQHSELRGFIAELLRLYPPLPFVTRLAHANDQLSDIDVIAGDVVVVSLVGVNNKALERDDPWVPNIDAAIKEGYGMGTGSISSFVWGKRVCGGRSFALVELATVLSVLIAQLKIEFSEDKPVAYEWVGQMRRKGGHPLRVSRRT